MQPTGSSRARPREPVCHLTHIWMRPRVAEHFTHGSGVMTVETEQLATFLKLSSKHITPMSMLCIDAVWPAPLSVLHTATRAILLRRKGHGAPSPRLMGVGDYFFGISSATSGLCAPRRAQTRCLMADTLTHALRPPALPFGLRIAAAAVARRRGAVLFATAADAALLPGLAQKFFPRAAHSPCTSACSWMEARGRLRRANRL